MSQLKMKKIILVVILIFIMITGIQNAAAHSRIISSVPSKNQIVKILPSSIWLEFNGHLISIGGKSINRLIVINSKKLRVDVGGTFVRGARISTKLQPGLQPGKYFVSYRIVSEDGHPVEGSYSFVYKPH